MSAHASVSFGFIGAGSMARAYVECLRRYTTGGRLVAVTGGSRAGELAADYGVSAEPSVGRLLERADVDAILIATPEMKHCEQTVLAASAGRHVLVEKPMAPTVRECDEMIAACSRAGVKLMVVKHWRFRGVHVRALGLLRAGKPGAVRSVVNHTLTTRSASLATVARKPFYLDPAGGGLLMGWATHNLDWVRCLAGAEPKSVVATLTRGAAPLGDGGLEARITFANGVDALVRVEIDLPDDPGPDQVFRTRIATDHGDLDLDGYGHLRSISGGSETIMWTQPPFNPRDPVDPLRLEAYAAMLQGFIDSVRRDTPPPVTGYDGRMAVALFHAVLESASSGRPVRFGD